MHAVLGVLLFGPLAAFIGGLGAAKMNPETAATVAIVGGFLVGVLLVLALATTQRVAECSGGKTGALMAAGLGLLGALVYGLAGTMAWWFSSLFVAVERGITLLAPAALAGAVAPLLAMINGVLFLFLERTGQRF